MKCKCPLCGGTGMAEVSTPKKADKKRELAKTMREEGFTIRRIQDTLGYKSSSTVVYLLNT